MKFFSTYLDGFLKGPSGKTSDKRVHAFMAFCVAALMGLGTFVLLFFPGLPAGSEVLILGLVGAFLGYALGCLGITSVDLSTRTRAQPPPGP